MTEPRDVDRSADPERARYDELFARNLPALAAFVRARVGAALAARESISDLTQSVCREVLHDLDALDFDSDEAFRAFLFLQASRKIVDRSRFHKMAKRDPGREVVMPTDAEVREPLHRLAEMVTPSRAAGAREELDRTERAIAELPDRERDAVLLHRVAGISYAQISSELELSESSVRRLVARGLARLAARLQ